MKVLIVDDEEHVRESVQLSVDWKKYQISDIFTAEDGLEALETVRREAPELIICDMSMPRMDGPTFLEALREEGWDSKVIVLSGYQEFRYTRATLLANGVDYLLKPFKISDLENAVSKAVKAIVESKRTKNEEYRKNVQLQEANMQLNEQNMSMLLQSENPNPEGVRQLLDEAGFPSEEFYLILYLPRNLYTIVDRHYMGDEILYFFAIRNIVRDVLKPLGSYYFFRFDPFLCVLAPGNRNMKEVEYSFTKLGKVWESAIKLKTFAGFPREPFSYRGILTAVKKAKAEILGTRVSGSGQAAATPKAPPTFIDKEILVLEALKNKDKHFLTKLVKSFVDELRNFPSLTLKDLQQCTIEVNLLMMRIHNMMNRTNHVETLPLWLCDLDEWEKSLTHMLWLMIETESDQLSGLQNIRAVHDYIASHIGENINLAFLSEKFHFSPQYISKKFKETYNTTVMNYLTGLRMEKAKSLLLHSDLTVSEISQLVGYEDDNYFSKVFRKQVGMSPTQFRKTGGAKMQT